MARGPRITVLEGGYELSVLANLNVICPLQVQDCEKNNNVTTEAHVKCEALEFGYQPREL